MASNQKTLLYLKEIEDAADLVLTNKQEIVDLDRKRNSNREALSAFEKQMKSDKNVWLAMGNSFIKLPRDKAQTMLKKDQVNLDAEINILRTKLKDNVNNLRDKEGEKKLKGFDLLSISKDEKAFIGP